MTDTAKNLVDLQDELIAGLKRQIKILEDIVALQDEMAKAYAERVEYLQDTISKLEGLIRDI